MSHCSFRPVSVQQRRSAGASGNERQTLVKRRCTALARCLRMGRESAALPMKSNRPAGIAPVLAPWLFNGGHWSRCLLVAARSSHATAHIAPCPWLCRSRPSAAPSAAQARQPQPQTLALRSRAGWSAGLRWGGRALSECRLRREFIGGPILAPLQGAGGGVGFLVDRESVLFGHAPRTTPSLHRDGLLSARASLRPSRHRAASPQCLPHREPPPCAASGRASLSRRRPPAGTSHAKPSAALRETRGQCAKIDS